MAEAPGLTSEPRDKIATIEAEYERKGMVLYRSREGDWREKMSRTESLTNSKERLSSVDGAALRQWCASDIT